MYMNKLVWLNHDALYGPCYAYDLLIMVVVLEIDWL